MRRRLTHETFSDAPVAPACVEQRPDGSGCELRRSVCFASLRSLQRCELRVRKSRLGTDDDFPANNVPLMHAVPFDNDME